MIQFLNIYIIIANITYEKLKLILKKEVSIMDGGKKKTYDFWIEKCCEQDRDMGYWLDTEKTLRVQIKK